MNDFTIPIKAGLIIFPFLALFITFPYVLRQYHKFGAVSKLRVLVVYSFVLYMLIAYFMVILPLPKPETTIGNSVRDHLQLQPLHYILGYFNKNGWTLQALRLYLPSWNFLQLAFNVILTIPFGVYLRYYFKRNFFVTMLLSLLLSIFYEGSQISALFGIYPGPYRLADVDDLICNTLGGIIGFIIAPMFVFFLPTREAMDKSNFSAGAKVTGMRRFWALLVDLIWFSLLYGIIMIVLYINKYQLAFRIFSEPGLYWTAFIFINWIICIVTKGKTPGKALCRMQIIGNDNHYAKNSALTKRYFMLFIQFALPDILFGIVFNLGTALWQTLICLFCVLWHTFFAVRYLWRVSFGKKLLPHVIFSQTKHISTLHEQVMAE